MNKGRLTVVTLSSQPPMVQTKDGHYEGFAIDLVNEIASKNSLQVDYKSLDYASTLPNIKAGQYDMGAFGILATDERKKVVSFSDPIYFGNFSLLAPKGSPLTDLQALAGHTVAVVQGSLQKEYLAQHQPAATTQTFPNETAALTALAAGRVDGFFVGGSTVPQFLKQYPQLQLMFKIDSPLPNGLPVALRSPRLLSAVNQQLHAMVKDGSFARLYKKWFPDEPMSQSMFRAYPEFGKQVASPATSG